ncbi:MAG: SEC59/DGK1/VTE5 family protein [Candidatus Hydrothermarchaeota archaeon]|nr:SEC59/DGK1/VTE5 family protein [Candidatus Hydrothermarchaeota archaeon]
MDLETRRQLIHMSGIAIPFYLQWSYYTWGFIIPLLSLVLAIIILYLLSLGYKNKFRVPVLSNIIDATERPEVIEVSPARGALMFLVGSTITLVLFSFNIAIVAASIAVLAMGDSFSTLAGKRLSRHRIPYNKKKSLEGSLFGFIAAFVGAWVLVSWPIALAGAMGGMLSESLPLRVDDNLIIPIAAALSMTALSPILIL